MQIWLMVQKYVIQQKSAHCLLGALNLGVRRNSQRECHLNEDGMSISPSLATMMLQIIVITLDYRRLQVLSF